MDDHCYVEPLHREVTAAEFQKVRVAMLAIEGMGCPNCAGRVRNSLIALYGVTDAEVDYRTGQAQVVFNPDLVGFPALIEAVRQAGNDGLHVYYASSERLW